MHAAELFLMSSHTVCHAIVILGSLYCCCQFLFCVFQCNCFVLLCVCVCLCSVLSLWLLRRNKWIIVATRFRSKVSKLCIGGLQLVPDLCFRIRSDNNAWQFDRGCDLSRALYKYDKCDFSSENNSYFSSNLVFLIFYFYRSSNFSLLDEIISVLVLVLILKIQYTLKE